MNATRPFHVTIVERLKDIDSTSELAALLLLVADTDLPAGHEEITSALHKVIINGDFDHDGFDIMGSYDNAIANLRAQAQIAQEKEERAHEEAVEENQRREDAQAAVQALEQRWEELIRRETFVKERELQLNVLSQQLERKAVRKSKPKKRAPFSTSKKRRRH